MSPEAAREELSRRADAIEGGYEMMLAYAAKVCRQTMARRTAGSCAIIFSDLRRH